MQPPLRLALTGTLALLAASCAPRPPATTAFDGTYRGESIAENDPGGGCTETSPTSTMTVSNGHVQLGQYSGYIEPDGSVQMQFRGIFISGVFQPGSFQGQVRFPQPGCIYRLDMPRVG